MSLYTDQNPQSFVDRTGEVPVVIALAWGLVEAGLTIWDIYETGTTLMDPCASLGDKVLSGGSMVMSAGGPGPKSLYEGLGKAGKKVLGAGKKVPEGAVSVNDVLKGAKPGRSTKGRTKQFEKAGGLDQADVDFDALEPMNVRDIPGGGRVGQLPDGRTAIVRPSSSGGSPTLEIQSGKNRIKIRYGE